MLIVPFYMVPWKLSRAQFTIYNKEAGCFEGFVNYGNDIIDDENEIATDALVFMLVSLKKLW